MSFLSELKRRNVFRVGAAYLVVAWLLVQVIGTLTPMLSLPEWVGRAIVLILLIGFPITLIIAWAFELTPEGIKPTNAVDPEQSVALQKGNKLRNFTIGGLILALLLVVMDAYVLTGSDGPDPENPEPLEKSLAVLPFTDLSPDNDQEYFSDGLSEELLNKLAHVDGLEVTARTSSFYYKGRNEDMRTIGEQLGVNYLLEGSVRKADNQLRITAQLIQADDGFHLWSQTYNRELADIFELQDEIAEAVTTALSITMNVGEFNQPGMTANVEAYEAFLQAKAHYYKFTTEDFIQAIEYIENTVALDPEFLQGWLWMERILVDSNVWLLPEQNQGFSYSIDEARQRARELLPENEQVQILDLNELIDAGRFAEAESRIQPLLDRPGSPSPELLFLYGDFLRRVGRIRESLPYMLQAGRRDALNSEYAYWLARIYVALGRYQEALSEVDRGISLGSESGPVKRIRWTVAYETGRRDGILSSLENMGLSEQDERAVLWFGGDTDAALAVLRTEVEGDVPVIQLRGWSVWAAVLGDPQLSLDLRRRQKGTSWDATLNLWEAQNSEVRKLPEFKLFAEEIGLLDYWRATGNWADKCRPLEGGDDFECS